VRWIEASRRTLFRFVVVSAVATSVDGDADDLSVTGRGCAEVGDVEFAVGTEGHAGGYGEAGGDVFDVSVAIDADDLAVARGGRTVGRG
jgi:hypothetical protein